MRKCSICRKSGHNKRTCPTRMESAITKSSPPVTVVTSPDIISNTRTIRETRSKVVTEDLGKIFERAICYALGIEYDGVYKYSEERAKDLSKLLSRLRELYSPTCIHTAKKGSPHDFTSDIPGKPTKYLSAKTVKKTVKKTGRSSLSNNKVAPQVIGQPSIPKLAEYLGCEKTEDAIRNFIITDPKGVLRLMEQYTFCYDIVYYNEKSGIIRYIKSVSNIPWESLEITFTQDWRTSGKNSTNIQIEYDGKKQTIAEIQIHTRSRKNMALRWEFEKVLEMFSECFDITILGSTE